MIVASHQLSNLAVYLAYIRIRFTESLRIYSSLKKMVIHMIVRATVSRINTQKYLIFVRSVDDDIRRLSYRYTRSPVEILHWSYSKINMSVFGYYMTVRMTVDSV